MNTVPKHVLLFDQIIPEERSSLRGGKGKALARPYIKPDERHPGSHFKSVGLNILEPGTSIGIHLHEQDEELYIVMKGRGAHIDNTGTRHLLKEGDMSICCKGEQHGFENTGSEPLWLIGILAD